VVVESTLDGETVWTLNRRKDSGVYEKEEQFKPSNTVVAPNGDIYVADGYGLSYVHQFSPRLERIRPWAGKGSEAASSMARTASGSTDRSNTRLHTFTLDGKHVGFIRLHQVRFPKAGPIRRLGDNPGVWQITGWPNLLDTTWVPGKFIWPHAAC